MEQAGFKTVRIRNHEGIGATIHFLYVGQKVRGVKL
jgi:hypothetical protein